MKSFMVVALALLTLGLVGNAHADFWFVERPDFMAHDLPDYHPCEVKPKSRHPAERTCSLQSEREGIVYSDGQKTWVERQHKNIHANCYEGFCQAPYEDRIDYLGKANHQTQKSITIPRYYYVWGSEALEGDTVLFHLYKRGTGPAAEQFPGWYVEHDTPAPMSLANPEGDIISVVCGERAVTHNECEVTIGGYRDVSGDSFKSAFFSVEEIREALHFAVIDEETEKTHHPDCYEGQCKTFRGHFIGLDPDFPLWQQEESTRVKGGYLSAYNHVDAPSFRCSAATKPVEFMICRVPKLRKADGIMGEMYQDLYRAANSPEANRIKADQSQWIKERDRACPVNNEDLNSPSRLKIFSECLMEQIELRSEELWREMNETAQ